ncbi:tRNA(Ile)-lysidine synthase [Striga asiatica]|uniref:tRNA(Ile)-lysidine synthase n=1 Tax=Striga asiatica TaxID=4170 RepID=A0A5A7QN53_STRAF|nr:tRNA(Ile)-lysidine synthase [Striga asiatica]
MRAERIAAGLQSGWAALSRAARPLTWGHDIDVPDTMLKSTLRLSNSRPEGPAARDHPARMSTPGAIRSGFSTSGTISLGPLELKAASAGDGLTPSLVLPNWNVALSGGGGGDIFLHLVARNLADSYGRKNVSVGHQLLSVAHGVG